MDNFYIATITIVTIAVIVTALIVHQDRKERHHSAK